ncbi:hypothetical protein L208DRAFT_670699 [Tricholoma matsutake]|nr:hypothetical protein L208DRAFT_670699 [Tricholoma matsutake 945]
MSSLKEPSSVNVEMMFGVEPVGDEKARIAPITHLDGSQRMEPNYPLEYKPITIENLRGNEASVTLDTAGFQFVHRPTKHKGFIDEEEIKREYYPECIELVKEIITGASSVFIFQHNIRSPRLYPTTGGRSKPSVIPHVDNSAASALRDVYSHCPAAEIPALPKRRFQRINIWRPIYHPAVECPLTLCDYRSINLEEDVFPVNLEYPGASTDELLVMKYNEKQQWKYVFGLTPDEAVVFKCFDTIQDGSVAVCAPHNSFKDPTTPEGAPSRESIEVRMIVFFD